MNFDSLDAEQIAARRRTGLSLTAMRLYPANASMDVDIRIIQQSASPVKIYKKYKIVQ